jgi:hypothetical protein
VTSEPGGDLFPAIDEITGFVTDYEQAAAKRFTTDERRQIGASAVWLLAYTARCEHALSAAGIARSDQDGARERLAQDGTALLDLA